MTKACCYLLHATLCRSSAYDRELLFRRGDFPINASHASALTQYLLACKVMSRLPDERDESAIRRNFPSRTLLSSSRRLSKRNETGRHEQEDERHALKHAAIQQSSVRRDINRYYKMKAPVGESIERRFQQSLSGFFSPACGRDSAPTLLESFWNFGTNESVTLGWRLRSPRTAFTVLLLPRSSI